MKNELIWLVSALISFALIAGCGGQIVKIYSEPAGAEVFSNRDHIGTTPLLTSKDEIMPLWSSDGTFTRAVLTLRKQGYQDYKEFVNELTMPDEIRAKLRPKTGDEL